MIFLVSHLQKFSPILTYLSFNCNNVREKRQCFGIVSFSFSRVPFDLIHICLFPIVTFNMPQRMGICFPLIERG